MASYFEVYENANEEYQWRLKASNGEVVALGEAYESKAGALESARKLKEWSDTEDIREI